MKLSIIFALPEVLRQGKALANSASWKNHQVTANMIAAFLASVFALLQVFLGIDLGVSNETLLAIGSGVLAVYGVYNSYVTTATSEKIGVQDKAPD